MDKVHSEDDAKTANKMPVPYSPQDVQVVASLVRKMDECTKSKKHGVQMKKTRFNVAHSRDGLTVDSWRLQDWDYKRRDLPTYARGLFTTKTRANAPEIAVRGYDKFFNVGEVHETRWDNIEARTQPPYELTLKENGCIIFVSGLEDDTLLVCSKHSTGDRSDVEISHASAGQRLIEAQLQKIGKTSQDLARELRKRNTTAVAELCDDTFEEHILAYGPDKAGLYLHGINLNLPEFATYPSPLVQQFAKEWGFVQTGLLVMDDIQQVRRFLEHAAETGAYEGRDVEGFVIRCRMSPKPGEMPWQDWFFKYKFEEPYLMYRQWRECTKALIAGKPPRYKKHAKITEEYLLYARKRLAADRNLGRLYNQNHGIIALRDDFLKHKNMKGSDAANIEEAGEANQNEVTRDIILVPIATIGCGKTTVALGLVKLLGFGHIQNDNITGTKRPPRFTKMVLDQLGDHIGVVADRNNAQRHERKQIITDVKMQHSNARLVALNYMHNDIEGVRTITRDRVFARGDNHQTIHAATDQNKVIGIMEGFVHRFEPCNPSQNPDDGFDAVIDLDPMAGSRTNLETTIVELRRLYPKLIQTMPTGEEMDAAIEEALEGYQPDLRHKIPDRNPKNKQQQQQPLQKRDKKRPLEYMAVEVPAKEINTILEKAFSTVGTVQSRFYKQLKQTRRVQPKFHVTLMHRANAAEHPQLWERYVRLHAESEMGANSSADAASGSGQVALGECEVQLERIVYDERIMAIVVRLQPQGHDGAAPNWECTNRVAHITIGTANGNVKPKESNNLLARWLEEGATEENRVLDLGLDGRPIIKGLVTGVLSR